jgi:hypothetical protein
MELFDATQPAVDEVRAREQITALEDLDVEILVLDAFERSRYKLRSAGGIARDTGIPREKLAIWMFSWTMEQELFG